MRTENTNFDQTIERPLDLVVNVINLKDSAFNLERAQERHINSSITSLCYLAIAVAGSLFVLGSVYLASASVIQIMLAPFSPIYPEACVLLGFYSPWVISTFALYKFGLLSYTWKKTSGLLCSLFLIAQTSLDLHRVNGQIAQVQTYASQLAFAQRG